MTKSRISTSVYNTVKVQVLFHDTNTWYVSLSVGEEHDSQPRVDHFDLIDFAFILGFPFKTSILK